MRKLAGNLNRAQTLCLFTNQIREKVGVMFGSPETQPGGRALKFYSSQRLDIRRIETLKDGTEAIGNRVKVKVVKNKVAPPFRIAEFDIEFGKGISTAGCLIDLGIEHDVVQKSGSFFSYDGERLGQGRNNAKTYLEEHPEIASEIEAKIYNALGIDRDSLRKGGFSGPEGTNGTVDVEGNAIVAGLAAVEEPAEEAEAADAVEAA
jgi:recombination protein RecA